MSADSMNSVFGFIGILAVGCGIYCLYAYFNMKKDGHINETILLGKSYSEKMCKDKEAYLKKALPAVLGWNCFDSLWNCRLYPLVCKSDGDGGHSGRHSFYGSTGGICSVYDATEKEIFLERYKGNINERESGGSDSLLTSYKLQK